MSWLRELVGRTEAEKAVGVEDPTRVRHVVLFLLVLHYANTYMDRVAISQAAPHIQDEFALSQTALGAVFTAFTVAYALFQVPGGWLADRFGPRKVLAGIVSYWSVFTMGTAAAWNRTSLLAIRFLFGAGEAGAFPAATRAFSRWLPATERGFAQGITHSGSRLAGALTPPLVAVMMTTWGWRSAFVAFGALGFVWAGVWYWYYRDEPEDHGSVNAAEMTVIRRGREGLDTPGAPGDPGPAAVEEGAEGEASGGAAHAAGGGEGGSGDIPWGVLLRSRNMWLVCLMYFCYVYTFWIYLTWIPTYLVESRGFSIVASGIGAGLPLLVGAVTNGLGGWVSDRLSARRGLRFGRRVPAVAGFVAGAAFIMPGVLIVDPWVAVACLTLAAGGLEFTTGISWAVAIDVGEEYAGTVSAMMNMFGNLGGAISPLLFGIIVDLTGRWEIPFAIATGLIVVGGITWLKIDPERSVLVE